MGPDGWIGFVNRSAAGEKEPGPIPLYPLRQYLSRHLDGVSTFECWKRSVDETWPLPHERTGKEVMIDFGKTLGISDREDQLAHLARVTDQSGSGRSPRHGRNRTVRKNVPKSGSPGREH